MSSPANQIKALAPWWGSIQEGAARAERNLAELQPCTTRVARDEAVVDQDAVRHCVALIRKEIVRLHGLVAKYDYPVGGEVTYGANVRQTSERWVNEHAEPGCTSCGRADLMIWSPIHQDGLCRWCYDFRYTEGLLPTTNLLRMHEDKVRMSQAIVIRELKPARDEAKRQAKRAAAIRQSRRKTKGTTPR
jgi:hypothetical protein